MAIPIVFRGMYGFGDCIHQRAILREAMRMNVPVILDTFYRELYDDLVRESNGLLRLRRIRGLEPRIRERIPLTDDFFARNARQMRITYNPAMRQSYGSIMAAQFASVNMRLPARPDFSIPVKQQWRVWARDAVARAAIEQDVDPAVLARPIMVYRPVVLNNLWRSEPRAPDTDAYAELFRSIRAKYCVVSVANLGNSGEHIVGHPEDVDIRFDHGELDFEELTGLFANAELAFTCPGFAPILAQAVGTRCVIVYGGYESHATTNVIGEHFAPTLAIEPDRPCACYDKLHSCDKYITLGSALDRLAAFVNFKMEALACAS